MYLFRVFESFFANGPRCLVQFVGCHDKSYEQSISGLPSRLLTLTFLLCTIPFQVLRLKRNFVAQETAIHQELTPQVVGV